MFINWPGYFDLWVKDVATPPQAAPTTWEIQELNPESFIPEGAEGLVNGYAITVALLVTVMKLIF